MCRYTKKSLPQLLEIAQKHFNTYVRKIADQGGWTKCVSCGKLVKSDLGLIQAGHYLSVGSCSYHRFNILNVHAQCVRCNMYLSGNLINYRINLEKKIGKEALELLEGTRHISAKWDRGSLLLIIEEYKSKLKQVA